MGIIPKLRRPRSKKSEGDDKKTRQTALSEHKTHNDKRGFGRWIYRGSGEVKDAYNPPKIKWQQQPDGSWKQVAVNDGTSKSGGSFLDSKIAINIGCIVWLIFCVMLFFILYGIFGGPLSIIAWLIGLDPAFVFFSLLMVSLFITLMVALMVRK